MVLENGHGSKTCAYFAHTSLSNTAYLKTPVSVPAPTLSPPLLRYPSLPCTTFLLPLLFSHILLLPLSLLLLHSPNPLPPLSTFMAQPVWVSWVGDGVLTWGVGRGEGVSLTGLPLRCRNPDRKGTPVPVGTPDETRTPPGRRPSSWGRGVESVRGAPRLVRRSRGSSNAFPNTAAPSKQAGGGRGRTAPRSSGFWVPRSLVRAPLTNSGQILINEKAHTPLI